MIFPCFSHVFPIQSSVFPWGFFAARQGRDRVMGSRTNELEALRLAREEKRQQEQWSVRW